MQRSRRSSVVAVADTRDGEEVIMGAGEGHAAQRDSVAASLISMGTGSDAVLRSERHPVASSTHGGGSSGPLLTGASDVHAMHFSFGSGAGATAMPGGAAVVGLDSLGFDTGMLSPSSSGGFGGQDLQQVHQQVVSGDDRLTVVEAGSMSMRAAASQSSTKSTCSKPIEVVQLSRYWITYRAGRTYRLHLHIYEARLLAEPSSGYSGNNADPYIVAYRHSNREGTKQKTRSVRKTLSPVWNHTLVFEHVEYDERFRLEIKNAKAVGTNVLLAHHEFVVFDFLSFASELASTVNTFVITPDKAGLSGTISLGCHFDPTVPSDNIFVDDTEPSPAAGAPTAPPSVTVEEPCYVNVGGGFVSFLFDSDLVPEISPEEADAIRERLFARVQPDFFEEEVATPDFRSSRGSRGSRSSHQGIRPAYAPPTSAGPMSSRDNELMASGSGNSNSFFDMSSPPQSPPPPVKEKKRRESFGGSRRQSNGPPPEGGSSGKQRRGSHSNRSGLWSRGQKADKHSRPRRKSFLG